MKAADHRAVRARVNPPTRDWRELVGGLGPCCEYARRLEPGDPFYAVCVCAYTEYCFVHNRVTHVGTHD